MKDIIAVRRYAKAYLDFAKKTIGIKRACEDIRNFKLLIFENEELRSFLNAREISDNERIKVLNDILVDYSAEFRFFLELLIKKNRIDKIIDIADITRIICSSGEEADVHLRSTSMLDTDILQEIKQEFEKIINKRLNLYVELDPDLLGGVQLMIGNKIIDGSVKKRLTELGKKLHAAKVV
ncbi:MAG TPA: ATP synthase F1 subunit delta [Candidatus Omnitrophota bacterium]|nr:ATP synthase F1 subunit delta [Candidatus Omnitrophota bacterium]